jgi:hypothetical protein
MPMVPSGRYLRIRHSAWALSSGTVDVLAGQRHTEVSWMQQASEDACDFRGARPSRVNSPVLFGK